MRRKRRRRAKLHELLSSLTDYPERSRVISGIPVQMPARQTQKKQNGFSFYCFLCNTEELKTKAHVLAV